MTDPVRLGARRDHRQTSACSAPRRIAQRVELHAGELLGEFERPDRFARCGGPADGQSLRIESGTRVRNFSAADCGVLAQTAENWRGAQVEADVPTSTANLGLGLGAWPAALNAAAESMPK